MVFCHADFLFQISNPCLQDSVGFERNRPSPVSVLYLNALIAFGGKRKARTESADPMLEQMVTEFFLSRYE